MAFAEPGAEHRGFQTEDIEMLRIHFTAEDLARVQISAGWGPLPEVLFSLQQLPERTPRALLSGWRAGVHEDLDQTGRPIAALALPLAHVDLMTLVGPTTSMDEAVEGLLDTSRPRLRQELIQAAQQRPDVSPGVRRWLRTLHDDASRTRRDLATLLHRYYRLAIDPYWEQMDSRLHIDRALRRRHMTEGGLEQLFTTLHHTIHWRPPVLEVMRPPGLGSTTVQLAGRSLILSPSIFCLPYPMLFLSSADLAAPAVLFYPALQQVDEAVALWTLPGSDRRPLETLLGRTRAIALEATIEPCTTTELARRLGVAPSTASHHASILRAAGLIDTRRYGGAVLHQVTSQGRLLLDGRRRE